MRIIRTVIAGLLAALLGMSALAATPAQAGQALPERTIEEKDPMDYQITFDTFKLKGKVTELQVDGITYLPYAKQKVQLQKKACTKPGCQWKTVKKFKTSKTGKYVTRIYAPRTGKWKWRVKVKGSDGYKTTKGEVWTLFFK
ncbi:hypothetical protein [Nocardioides piscis]|uniref:DUF1883 domain-containing protein n=1 Tax=Nocardioides piscis TaxID=2714938 RepID=A0A6G7YCC5_9ACTN|nr:hypothetical protein [Nocardioides piscis]QIK74472.1 hypothetical protein G7071_02485 [Nocardioides piscis]